MSDILDLGGRVAFVTGAGQGVGRQIALHLAAHNAGGVAVNDFVLERAEKVVEEIRAAGGKALAVQADVAKTEEAFGKVGVLVNNAGNAGATPHADARKPFWETGPEAWNSFIGVNFYGVVNCTSACIPGMIERGAPGRIITIISEASRYGDVGLEVYAGAKAGAAGFMRATARALGRYHITANCVAIAATLTPAIEARLKADPERYKKMMNNYVIRRPGQTYGVNGGFTFGL